MASGTFYLEDAYNSQSPNCIEAYVSWSSVLNSGSSHTVSMALYAKRIDYTGATTIQYSAPSGGGWTRTYTNSSLVFQNKSYIHICTVETTVTSNSSGVASFSGASFYAGFYSSSYGTRRMSGTIYQLTLDKPKVTVSIDASNGISVTTNKSSYSVGENITFTITITNTTRYSGYYISSITGATLVSGTTYKITGNVSITVRGYLRTYDLIISASHGVSVTVSVYSASGTLWKTCTASTANALPYSYHAVVQISIANGYEFVSMTINGDNYDDDEEPTIVIGGNITVNVQARESGAVYIRDENGINRYQVYIYTNEGWNIYKPMLFTNTGWGVCN